MKSFIILSLLLGLATSAIAQTAPTNPIEIETEIGAIGGGNAEKTTVSCLVRITKQEIAYFIRVGGLDQDRGQDMLELGEDVQAELISAIEKVRAQDKDMKVSAAGYSISAATSAASGVRTLSIENEKQIFPRRQVRLDPDGTDSVVAMMKKARTVQAWLKTRADALKP